jgi:hypothetical protein
MSDGRNESGKRFKDNYELLLYLYMAIINKKKWWLLPLLALLAFLSLFVGLSTNSSVLPLIYAIF